MKQVYNFAISNDWNGFIVAQHTALIRILLKDSHEKIATNKKKHTHKKEVVQCEYSWFKQLCFTSCFWSSLNTINELLFKKKLKI